MSRASTATLLSLDRWAKLLHINPIHFSGAVGSSIWPANGACEDIWPQYSWQTDHELVGREEVAMQIAIAEQDIKLAMRHSPAATWEVDESHMWNGLARTRMQSAQTEYGMVIAPGKRAVSLIESAAAVVYSDPDGDGWAERATIIVSTDVTDKRQVKLYYTGHDGEPEWEIRPLRSVTLASGVATIVVDAWELFDPDLWEEYPNVATPFVGIDVTVGANYVTEVDVYREYNDVSQASVAFYPATNGYLCCGGVGCDICNGASAYGGCFSIRDKRLGIIYPFPATYADGSWSYYSAANCQPADRVALSYYAGLQDKDYLNSKSLDPLSHYMAETIMMLSVARLPDAVCNCNNIRDRVEYLQKDLSTLRDGGQGSTLYARFQTQDIFNNPFGTRVGEVAAWKRIYKLHGEIGDGGLL